MIRPQYKKFFTILTIFGLIAFGAIQFIPSSFSRTNPPVTGEPVWDSPATRSTFMKACGDCHSNETVYPWYSHIAPVSMLIENDVKNGRRHFNISQWNLSVRGGDDAVEQVQKGSMPDGLYLLMHAEANLNASEKKIFAAGLQRTFNSGDAALEHERKEEKE